MSTALRGQGGGTELLPPPRQSEFFRKHSDLTQRIGPAPDAVASDLEATEKALLNAPGNWAPSFSTGSPGTRP